MDYCISKKSQKAETYLDLVWEKLARALQIKIEYIFKVLTHSKIYVLRILKSSI
jgi:hypothetical protein